MTSNPLRGANRRVRFRFDLESQAGGGSATAVRLRILAHRGYCWAVSDCLQVMPVMRFSSNNSVQATPDCALLFIVAQVSGAPDRERSA